MNVLLKNEENPLRDISIANTVPTGLARLKRRFPVFLWVKGGANKGKFCRRAGTNCQINFF
jgi:hypothetical protein